MRFAPCPRPNREGTRGVYTQAHDAVWAVSAGQTRATSHHCRAWAYTIADRTDSPRGSTRQ